MNRRENSLCCVIPNGSMGNAGDGCARCGPKTKKPRLMSRGFFHAVLPCEKPWTDQVTTNLKDFTARILGIVVVLMVLFY